MLNIGRDRYAGAVIRLWRSRFAQPKPAFALALLALGGCAVPSGTERFEGQEGELEILATYPASGQRLDTRRVHIDFCLNKRIDPASLAREDLRVRSGIVFYDAAVEIELLNWREQGLTSAATNEAAAWCEGSVVRLAPRSQLEPGVEYRVTFYDGVRGWRGERFDLADEGWFTPAPADTEGSTDDRFDDPRFVLTFSIDPDAPAIEEPSPGAPISLVTLFEADQVFDTEGVCSCHSDSGYPAFDLLNLSTPELAYQALVLDPRLSTNGARRVAPGAPASSYLIQKLVRNEQGETLHAIPGLPMPVSDPISQAHLAQLSAWIYEGAAP